MARRLTQHSQRAWADAVSHRGDGGVVAVVEERRGRAGTGNGDGGDDHGGSVELDGDATPAVATMMQSKAWASIY